MSMRFSKPPSRLNALQFWQRPPADPVEHTMRELARQGTTMARVAHLFATLMVVLFSLGSLVALSGDAFTGIVTTLQQGGMPSIPQAISIAVSTLMVVCCDIGLVYAAMTLRVLRTRGTDEGRLLHLVVLIGVSVIEASTYFYMSVIYEHPQGWALFLVIARALTAPLLSVYLSMARAHPVTPRDILHQAELAQGIQLVRDVVRVAQDPSASLADKMRLYEASAEMSSKDKTRLQGMIAVVQQRLAAPSQHTETLSVSPVVPALPEVPLAPDTSANTPLRVVEADGDTAHALEALSGPSSPTSAEDGEPDEPDDNEDPEADAYDALLPRGRYNPRRLSERIEATR